jgi:hypothetical protein
MSSTTEKQLRVLMKTGGNKKCADCGEQCAVNVDTTHGIFVCTSCSGIHREFGDRIKSISMASFTKEDITLLKAQTNDSFNEIWMAKWKGEIPLPLNADDMKRRTFLIAKYQDKRWYSRRVASTVARRTTTATVTAPATAAPISFTPNRPQSIKNTPSLPTPTPASASASAPPPKQVDIVDDLLDLNTPISTQAGSNQNSKNSLLDLSRLINDPPSVPIPQFPPSIDILRPQPKNLRDLLTLW